MIIDISVSMIAFQKTKWICYLRRKEGFDDNFPENKINMFSSTVGVSAKEEVIPQAPSTTGTVPARNYSYSSQKFTCDCGL